MHMRTMTRRLTAIFTVLLAVLFVTAGCKDDEEKGKSGDHADLDGMNYVTLHMADDLGDIVIELEPDEAPLTVANFRKLVHEGFYDNLTFHRIEPAFVIQGGDPRGDGTGGSKDRIKGEFTSNGVENHLKHARGVVSMARSQDPNSATSQFFIVLSDHKVSHLDGEYAAFGRVVAGMDVVDKIVDNYMVDGTIPVIEEATLAETNPAGGGK